MGDCTITIVTGTPTDRLWLAGLVDAAGRYNWSRIRSEIEVLTSDRIAPPFRWHRDRARRAVLREARWEREDVLLRLQRAAEHAVTAAEREQAAQDTAARYGYDTAALRFQADRRRFGTFSTTLDRHDLARFDRALTISLGRCAIAQAAE